MKRRFRPQTALLARVAPFRERCVPVPHAQDPAVRLLPRFKARKLVLTDDTICLRASVSTGQGRLLHTDRPVPSPSATESSEPTRAAPGNGRESLCFLRGLGVPKWTVYGGPCFLTYQHGVPGPQQWQPGTLVKTILTDSQPDALPGDTLQGRPVRVPPRDMLLGVEDTLSE